MSFGYAMPMATAWELGKRWYRDRLGAEWEPKTLDVMRAIFADVGLSGEFWSVP